MTSREEKELMQELGMVNITPDLYGIKRVVGDKELIVPASRQPARIVIKEDDGTKIYEEDFETYKERQKMMKHSEKTEKRGQLIWDSSVMGTYRRKTAAQVEKQYEKINQASTPEEAGKILEKIAKKNIKNARV